MRKLVSAVAIRATVVGGGVALAATVVGGGVALAAPSSIDPICKNMSVMGHGGGRCDSATARDGSFTRCDTFSVFGIRGTNCYKVHEPAPSAPPAPAPSLVQAQSPSAVQAQSPSAVQAQSPSAVQAQSPST